MQSRLIFVKNTTIAQSGPQNAFLRYGGVHFANRPLALVISKGTKMQNPAIIKPPLTGALNNNAFAGLATTNEGMKLINELDFSMVKLKLMDHEDGLGWSKEYADAAEVRYKRYLYMLYVAPEGSIVPTQDIDKFWHQHILDTRAYAEDCDRVFGEFIHHFPYFGMRGDQDARNLDASFEETKALYAGIFNEAYCGDGLSADAMRCTKCSSCKGKTKCYHK